MQTIILERIRQTNPWLFGKKSVGDTPQSRLPENFIFRQQVELSKLSQSGRAHLIIGPRQAGKSTLIWSFLSGFKLPLFVNLEESSLASWCSSPAQFMSDLKELGDPDVVFLEEVQRLSNAAMFIKGLVDFKPKFPILATGSASFHLMDKVRESLAGRATRHTLLPFSLSEVAPYNKLESIAVNQSNRKKAMLRQVRIGGYPEAWLNNEPQGILGELVQAFVLRDASDLFQVDRIDAYQALLELCARQVSNLVNFSEYASIIGVSSNTVAKYISLLQEAHVIKLVPSFSAGKRREVTSARKVFFVDNGLRNLLLGRLDDNPEKAQDKGALFENWVFGELYKSLPWIQTIRYWRSLSQAEVDFVINSPKTLLGIEVKATARTKPTISRSSRSFIGAYAPKEFWIANNHLQHTEQIEKTIVKWVMFENIPEQIQQWRQIAM